MNKGKAHNPVMILTTLLVAVFASAAGAQTWTPAQLLNNPVGVEVKSGQLWPATGGGFHAVYWVKGSNTQICYRKFQNGYLSPQSTVFTASFSANPSVAESYDGKVYVTWEDWSYDPSVAVGMGVSTDGGVTWQRKTITPVGYNKYPVVLPYGGGSKMMMTYAAPQSNNIRYALFDGSQWLPEQIISGSGIDSEYRCGWACTSPYDGSIWRLYGDKQGSIYWYIRRWNGTSWEAPITVNVPLPNGFPARPGIAANALGHVGVIWDENSAFYMRVYDSTTGTWRPQIKVRDKGSLYGGPNITNIPGSADFYVAFDGYGCRYYAATNSCGPQEDMIVGMSHGFSPDTALCAGADGTIYAAFENWNSGTAQWYYTIRPVQASGPSGTIAGKVTDQYSNPVVGVTVGTDMYSAITNNLGNYTLSNVPVGTRTVSANKQFYTSQTVNNVVVNQSQTTTLNFTVQAVPPAPVTGLTAVASDRVVRLYWQNPSSGNYASTTVVCRTTGYPTAPNDGVVVCDRLAGIGSSDNVTDSGLTNGVTRYYSVFTRDNEYHYSQAMHISAAPHTLSCLEAKEAVDGAVINLTGKVVTAIFPSDVCIYVADADRASGIRVANSGTGLAVGDVVNVSGTMAGRALSGIMAERYINSATVTKTSQGQAKPVAMTCRNVGGATMSANIMGVKNGVGLNNMGMLVRICGKVIYKASYYIYVDDGSNVENLYGSSTPMTGVMVKCPTSPSVNVGDIVTVTGIVEGSVPGNPDWTANRSYLHIRTMADLK